MWPKTIYVKGIGIPVESWEEFDEIVSRYGGGNVSSDEPGSTSSGGRHRHHGHSTLSQQDQVLLRQFIENGSQGVLNSHIGPMLNVERKGISPALRGWARSIGLVGGDKVAFDKFTSASGRGYKLIDGLLPMAKELLGMK